MVKLGYVISMFKLHKVKRKGISEKKATREITYFSCCGFYSTVEGCVLSYRREFCDKVQERFNSQPYEIRRAMCFIPKDNEFICRYMWWKELLKPILTEQELHNAMFHILEWYIHIKHLRSDEFDKSTGKSNE